MDKLTEAYEVTITIEKIYKKLLMYVIPGLNYDVLLGTDAARLFELQLHFNKKPIQPLYHIQEAQDPYDIALHEADKLRMNNLLKKYDQTLASKYDPLGITTAIKHDIDTGNEHPIRQQPYRQSPEQKRILEAEIKELLNKKVIRPSESPWSSPVVMVPKPDGTTRVCIDYRKLNGLTKKDAHPLPKIDEMLDHLKDTRVFSTMDLLSGFHQVPLTEDSIPKTAFTSHMGLYEYVRMPFGLCNAPATFQRLVEKIFSKIMWRFVMLYIDDIIIFSKNITEHFEHLTEVLDILQKHQLQAKLSKCKFFKSQLTFLGHQVTPEGILPLAENVKTVQGLKEPETLKELRSFLGMTAYYRKFIENYAGKARPLTRLLKKDEAMIIGPEQRKAIDQLKSDLSTPPILKYPDYDRRFHVITDASKEKIGHVITQQYDKKFHPIRYGGRQLNAAEKNYTISEKEALALLHAIRKNHAYLHGRDFTVHTDHLPLKNLMTAHDPTGRLARWFLTLQQYNFEIKYLPGEKNQVADALSRLNEDQSYETRLTEVDVHYIQIPTRMKQLMKDDRQMQILKSNIKKTPSQYPQYTIDDEAIYYQTKGRPRQLYVPTDARQDLMSQYHTSPLSGHCGMNATTQKLTAKYYWPDIHQDLVYFVNNCQKCNQMKGRTAKANLYPYCNWKTYGTITERYNGTVTKNKE